MTDPMRTGSYSGHERSTAALRRLIAELQEDQRARWQRGERPLVEAYLEQHPALRTDPDGVLDLIYNEVLLREEAGEPPALDEYLRRFPQFAGPLRDQFEIHGVLESNSLFEKEKTPTTSAPTPAGPEAAGPESVPGYQIVGELGRGGMGVVYQVWQTSLNRMAALKMILAGSHAGEQELARFRTEAEAVARLQHPNIVQIYEVGQQDGRPWM